MKRSRFSDEQIIAVIKENEARAKIASDPTIGQTLSSNAQICEGHSHHDWSPSPATIVNEVSADSGMQSGLT